MFNNQQKRYALFFRGANASSETPIEHRVYQCADGTETIRGTRTEIRSKITEYIPIFIDKIRINEIPINMLPIIGDR